MPNEWKSGPAPPDDAENLYRIVFCDGMVSKIETGLDLQNYKTCVANILIGPVPPPYVPPAPKPLPRKTGYVRFWYMRSDAVLQELITSGKITEDALSCHDLAAAGYDVSNLAPDGSERLELHDEELWEALKAWYADRKKYPYKPASAIRLEEVLDARLKEQHDG